MEKGAHRVVGRGAAIDGNAGHIEIHIRRGIPADISALRAIECEVFDLEQLTARSFRRYLGLAGADLVVAIRNGELVGYGIASYRRGSSRGRLVSIAVATRACGRGIGMQVLLELQAQARARGISAIRLEVRRDNVAALSLYGRAGYAIIGHKHAYYADFCDAIMMERGL